MRSYSLASPYGPTVARAPLRSERTWKLPSGSGEYAVAHVTSRGGRRKKQDDGDGS